MNLNQNIDVLYFEIAQLFEDAKIVETGDSYMFFVPYYMDKYFMAINYFKRYNINGDLTVLAQKLVRKYCVSGNYSLKDDYNEAFLNFLTEEYDKMRKVANVLDESNLKGRLK